MVHVIKVKTNRDFRSFKKDYEVTFDYTETDTIFLMGINGCGKSTIIQAIRGELNSNKDAKSKWGARDDCKFINEMFDVNIEGFDKIYHLDVDGLDNAYSMYNACDASAFVENGGWGMQHFSSGEKNVLYLARLRKDVIDDENSLIIFDEMDNHLDFSMRIKFSDWLNKIFPKSKKLIITHDILMATVSGGNIVEINAERTKESNKLFCKVFGTKPVVWKDDVKNIFFQMFTKFGLTNTVAKNEDNVNKE